MVDETSMKPLKLPTPLTTFQHVLTVLQALHVGLVDWLLNDTNKKLLLEMGGMGFESMS